MYKIKCNTSIMCVCVCVCVAQELQPKGRDVLKEEMGDMVDKELIATSTAIEEAVLRMDVSRAANNC